MTDPSTAENRMSCSIRLVIQGTWPSIVPWAFQGKVLTSFVCLGYWPLPFFYGLCALDSCYGFCLPSPVAGLWNQGSSVPAIACRRCVSALVCCWSPLGCLFFALLHVQVAEAMPLMPHALAENRRALERGARPELCAGGPMTEATVNLGRGIGMSSYGGQLRKAIMRMWTRFTV